MRHNRPTFVRLSIVSSLETLLLTAGLISPVVAFGGIQSCVSVTPGQDNLQKVIDSNPSGTTFCLRAGIYRMTKAVVVKSYDVIIGDSGAVLNGSKILSSFSKSGNYWVAYGQNQQAPVGTGDKCFPSTYTGCKYAEGVFVDDKPLWQVTSLAQLTSGKFYFDYTGDKIYLADNPSGHKVETSVAPGAFIGYVGYQDNVTIKSLVIEKFANWPTTYTAAIKPGKNWVIENNQFRFNHRSGVVVGQGTILRGNYLHHNGEYGANGGPGSGIQVLNNQIAYNNNEGFDVGYGAGGTKFTHTTNLLLRYNWVHDNIGPGLWCDGDSIYTVYEYNTVTSNTAPGIKHEISYDATIRYNTVRYNNTANLGKSIWWGSDIHILDSPNVQIYGNTVESNSNGIGLVDIERGSGAYGHYEIRNDLVHDNTVKMKATADTGLVANRSDPFTRLGNSFKNDTYYVTDMNGVFWQWQGGQTKTGWQANGQDLTGKFYSW
jgi:parallel beta-helix repeat protein